MASSNFSFFAATVHSPFSRISAESSPSASRMATLSPGAASPALFSTRPYLVTIA